MLVYPSMTIVYDPQFREITKSYTDHRSNPNQLGKTMGLKFWVEWGSKGSSVVKELPTVPRRFLHRRGLLQHARSRPHHHCGLPAHIRISFLRLVQGSAPCSAAAFFHLAAVLPLPFLLHRSHGHGQPFENTVRSG